LRGVGCFLMGEVPLELVPQGLVSGLVAVEASRVEG
jgi:hypothetical protein